jgi:hypothetical protein
MAAKSLLLNTDPLRSRILIAHLQPKYVSAKHLSAYLDEMTFRFNNRNNPYLFRDTMMKLIEAPVLEYKNLTRAA